MTIAYPYATEESARFGLCMQELVRASANRLNHPAWRAANSSGANITNARNEIVASWLRNSDADWLFFFDTDMIADGVDGRTGSDLIERLVRAAHPVDRPIVGALCFSWQRGNVAAPTMYVIRADNKVGRMLDYPRDQLVEVDATGTGCVLVHRSVFEKVLASGKGPAAYPWFQETALGDLPLGEDVTFMLRARACGFPVFVDTSIKVGHEKKIIVDENVFAAQQACQQVPSPSLPTYVVIPAKNRHDMTYNLIGQLAGQADGVFLFDNGSTPPLGDPSKDGPFPGLANTTVVPASGLTITEMWNAGLDLAATAAGRQPHNVAILNNDLNVPADFIARLADGLRRDDSVWVTYPNWHAAEIPPGEIVPTKGRGPTGRSLSGWAFMLRGELGLRIDEQFRWWAGDDDLQLQVESSGGLVACVGGCYCEHLEPNKSTERSLELQKLAEEDLERFHAKWGDYLASRR